MALWELENTPITELTDLNKRNEIISRFRDEFNSAITEEHELLYYVTKADADSGRRSNAGMEKGRNKRWGGETPADRARCVQETMNNICKKTPQINWSNNKLIEETAKESKFSKSTIRRYIANKSILPSRSAIK